MTVHSLDLDTIIVFSMPDDQTPNNIAAEAEDLDVVFNEEDAESRLLRFRDVRFDVGRKLLFNLIAEPLRFVSCWIGVQIVLIESIFDSVAPSVAQTSASSGVWRANTHSRKLLFLSAQPLSIGFQSI